MVELFVFVGSGLMIFYALWFLSGPCLVFEAPVPTRLAPRLCL